MARLKSEDKREALLNAAIELIAEEGISAPTAKIAKRAGVAEGSLFTYFRNKDELLNQVYLRLKADLQAVLLDGYPHKAGNKARIRHGWQRYVNWGVAQPLQRKVLAQLSVSDKISDASKAAGSLAFAGFNQMLAETLADGVLRKLPPAFAGALMGAMAEVTMDFMLRSPAQAEAYGQGGFDAFWQAIAEK